MLTAAGSVSETSIAPPTESRARRVAILVIGMHRSGTSALTRVMSLLGADLPSNLMPAVAGRNETAHWESMDVCRLNDEILASAGSSWNDWRRFNPDWIRSPVKNAFKARALEILERDFGRSSLFVLKDPRICRLLPFWLEVIRAFGAAPKCILPIRNPLEVAASLARRDNISPPFSHILWLRHVLDAECESRGLPRVFTEYHRLLDDWRGVARLVSEGLSIAWPRHSATSQVEIDQLIEHRHRHHAACDETLTGSAEVAEWVKTAYTALKLLQERPDSPDACTRLDAVRGEFERASDALGALVRSEEMARSAAVTAASAEASELLAEREREIQALRLAESERDTQITGLNQAVAERDAQIAGLNQAVAERDAQIAGLNQAVAERDAQILSLQHAAWERDALVASTSWRITRPMRALVGLIRGESAYRARLAEMVGRFPLQGRRADSAASPQPSEGPIAIPQASSTHPAMGRIRIVYVSGEAHTPGHHYRVQRYADSARAAGADVAVMRVEDSPQRLPEISAAQVIVIWRAAWSDAVAAVIATARQAGCRIVFDFDDLLIDPDLARSEVVDGIRSQKFSEPHVRELFALMRRSMQQADLCTVTTEGLAAYARAAGLPALVLPNGFDEATLATSRLAARRRAAAAQDGVLRIGYASGSATHQRDFALCAVAVAEALRSHPEARLVLFWDGHWKRPTLDVEEFPALAGLEDQIEWRDLVPLERLPEEVARFDVNLAPLEVGNPFCEGKSELKFFEAALANVCTIASPTEPFRRAIRNGETGFLAATDSEWRDALSRLLDDPGLRARMAKAAYHEVLWTFGPERRAELTASAIDYFRGGRAAARTFALDLRAARQPTAMAPLPETEVVFSSDRQSQSDVTVIVPLYNYANFITEALDSVAHQTLGDLDLIVIDDASTDDSLAVALSWVRHHASRFNRLLVLRNLVNSGLGPTRNVGFDVADTHYVLPLDADNRLLPDCLGRCLSKIRATRAAYAYPVIQQFEGGTARLGTLPFDPLRFVGANYVDAMALVAKAAWVLVGGYHDVCHGWEDYDFWCRLAEQGLTGEAVGGEPLAEYRVHGSSMLRTVTDLAEKKAQLMEEFEQHHPWVALINRPETDSAPATPTAGQEGSGLDHLLPLLRCPETGQPLELDADGGLRTVDGTRRWPVVAGRPVLFSGLEMPTLHPDQHISNPLPEHVASRIRATDGLVLNLSAGGTANRLPNVIEAEAAIFRHTDVVADVHHLPFGDELFAGVVALNAFEHYAEPTRAAAEIRRVVKPGGWVLIQTAFLQPLHEAPWHFFNCTKHGLLRWFADFEVEHVHVSDNLNPVYAISWLAAECEAALRQDVSTIAADRFLAEPIATLVAAWRDPAARQGQIWDQFHGLPQSRQEAIAAGFELIAKRPST